MSFKKGGKKGPNMAKTSYSTPNNDKASGGTRHKGSVGPLFSHAPDQAYIFGTPDEVSSRVGGSFRTLPESTPTRFRQIGPSPRGGSMPDADIRRVGAGEPHKFGNGRKYI